MRFCALKISSQWTTGQCGPQNRHKTKQGMIPPFLPYGMSTKECESFSIKWGQKKEQVKRQDDYISSWKSYEDVWAPFYDN